MLLAKSGGSADKLYVDSLFQTYLYTGNGSTQTITNGIDLAGKGGLVWIKKRDNLVSSVIEDTARGRGKNLQSDGTSAQTVEDSSHSVISFNNNGFSLGLNEQDLGSSNYPGDTYASWTFRKAPKFFDVQTKSHTNGSASTVDLSSLGTVGMVSVKRTDSTGSWYVWHRSLSSGYNIYLEQTAAQFNTNAYLSVSGTTLTIASGMPTGTYVVYSWAHDTDPDGMIQCGSFTTDGSGNATVNLGWADGAQYVQIKASSTTGDWEIYDTARTAAWSGSDARLRSNLSNAEDAVSRLSASGSSASFTGLSASRTYIYLTIAAPEA